MAAPKRFVRVEWLEKVWPDGRIRTIPREQHRNFERLDAAAEQVASVQSWPGALELVGVFETGTAWSDTDVEQLLAEHLSDDAAERYALLASTRDDADSA